MMALIMVAGLAITSTPNSASAAGKMKLSKTKLSLKVGKSKTVDHRWRIALITVVVIVMLQFFVEPILSGSPMLFYSFIIMDGALARWLYDQAVVQY